MSVESLITHARKAQTFSKSPYSNYAVGAALLTSEGEVIYGCNIESKAYPTTLCAERVAIFSAISQGHDDFSELAIITKDGAAPCGACRQIISEYCGNIPVHFANEAGESQTVMMDDLLPLAFRDPQ
ncbi:MAG: cytidine deaminase [Candidatus Marinimicrobia bacterium]|nr:cytidine deaminase [Candidatus Neomarinimicrobiota bacterium]